MKRATAIKYNQAFYDALDEHGDDKSTEFLISIAASNMNAEYGDIVSGMYYCHEHGIKADTGEHVK